MNLEGEAFLEAASVGLLPFTPLMKPPEGINTEAWLQRCVEKTEAALIDTQTRGTLLFALSLLGGLVHDPSFFEKLITEEIMQESPFYEIVIKRGVEQGVQQGVQQGSRETTIKNVLSVLTERFPQSDVQPVVEALESFQDLDHLTILLRKAVKTPSVKEFLQAIDS